MSRLDDRETVLRLALLIEDRTNQEQLAMLREAVSIDDEKNSQVVTNKRWRGSERLEPLSRLADEVRATRVISQPGDRPVDLPGKQRDAIAKRFAIWEQNGGAA